MILSILITRFIAKCTVKENFKHVLPKMKSLNHVITIHFFFFTGILTSIKKENDEKSEEGTDITMSFPSGHDSTDGLHYRVQGTFTRYVKF